MSAALQIASSTFDQDFLSLSAALQERINRKIDEMGLRLREYPHYRMKGTDRLRLRVGDYRVIYRVDVERNIIYLLALGHRREIYR